jgi:hypothetical protein
MVSGDTIHRVARNAAEALEQSWRWQVRERLPRHELARALLALGKALDIAPAELA